MEKNRRSHTSQIFCSRLLKISLTTTKFITMSSRKNVVLLPPIASAVKRSTAQYIVRAELSFEWLEALGALQAYLFSGPLCYMVSRWGMEQPFNLWGLLECVPATDFHGICRNSIWEMFDLMFKFRHCPTFSFCLGSSKPDI